MSAAQEEKYADLDDDYITVPGQLFALVSFVAPTGTNQRNDKFGMKIRGCFATKEEAHQHVKRLQNVDKTMDIYLVDMYKWLLIPPDPNAVENQEYQEEFLNNLVKGYRENQELAKQHFLERKEAVKKDGVDAHLLEHEKMPPLPAPPVVEELSSTEPAADSTTAPDTVPSTAPLTAMFEQDDPLTARQAA